MVQVEDAGGGIATLDLPFAVFSSVGGFSYTRTPPEMSVTNPVSFNLKGVFGADFCHANSNTFRITAQSGYYDELGFLIPTGSYVTNNVNSVVGASIDQTWTVTLPTGNYVRVILTCLGGGSSGQTSTYIEQGNPAAFTVFDINVGNWKQGVANQPYSLQLSTTGAVAPYIWTISSGTLPAGLTIDSSTGLISGTPLTVGAYPFTVQVQDANGGIATLDLPFAVYASVGGFSYNRTPIGSNISNPVTFNVKGVFGADLCHAQSNSFRINVIGGYYETSNVTAGVGSPIDQTWTVTLPTGNYTAVYLICFGGGSAGQTSILLEGGFTATNNVAPVIETIDNKSVDEGEMLEFTVVASDPNQGDVVTLSANNLPIGASFNPQKGIFSWTPGFDDAGVYPNVEFTATDNANPSLSNSESISITVNDVNRAPVLSPVGNQSVSEGQLLQFTISATDPDNDDLTFSAANLPPGAVFEPQTATFSWMPDFTQAGNYEDVEFTVTDDGSPMELDVELITVTVGNVNRAPVFDTVPPQEVLEDVNLTFTVNATDPDGNSFTLSATNLPTGATFDAQTGEFSWTPDLMQEGVYVVTFEAADDGSPSEIGTLDVVITVGDNPTPTEQAEALVETVLAYEFPTNVENSYLANLKKIAKFIDNGQINAAIGQLEAFIDKVEDDYSNSIISQAVRDDLVGLANTLLADLQ